MQATPQLIVMLTQSDYTVEKAIDIYEQCKDTDAIYWGIKESPRPLQEMKELYARMKACGKKTILEVVAYTEQEGLAGAQMAAECGCDILLGSKFFPSINDYCRAHNLLYMPFVGHITGRPSVLSGDIDEIIAEAQSYVAQGVYGINLLGYRYTGDATLLCRKLVEAIDAPVCLAGSINSYTRLDEVKETHPWAFTIGSAFFEQQFGSTFAEQIEKVCDYIKQ